MSRLFKRQFGVFVLLAFASSALAADPILGTWKLNLAKSRYFPGPPPRSQTRVYTPTPGGIHTVVSTVNADGSMAKSEYAANEDGKEYPVNGNTDTEFLRLQHIDDRTSEAKLIHADRVLATVLRVVSEDGKTLTIAYQGQDVRGEVVQYKAVFDKQ